MRRSATLVASQIAADRKRDNLPVYNFGLGACPLPAPACMVAQVREHAHLKDYTPAQGIPELQAALRRRYVHAAGTLVGNGVKPLLHLLFMHWPGRIVIPTPAWVSYMAQVKMLRKEMITIPGRVEHQFKLTPGAVRASCRPGDLVVLTHPNNPTGAVYTAEELEALGAALREQDATVVADEIYLHVAYDPVRSLAQFAPERTICLSSLSKEVGCGGWRCGWAVFPSAYAELHDRLVNAASSIYSCASHMLQKAAVYALSYPPPLVAHLRSTRRTFRTGAQVVYDRLSTRLTCTKPAAAWYTWVNFDNYAEVLRGNGIASGDDLAMRLANDVGFIAVPGDAFGVSGLNLRLSFVDLATGSDPWATVKQGIAVLFQWLDALPSRQ